MPIIEMKVPSPGESIAEVQIARWIKQDGDIVEKDEELCEIDSDKATLMQPLGGIFARRKVCRVRLGGPQSNSKRLHNSIELL